MCSMCSVVPQPPLTDKARRENSLKGDGLARGSRGELVSCTVVGAWKAVYVVESTMSHTWFVRAGERELYLKMRRNKFYVGVRRSCVGSKLIVRSPYLFKRAVDQTPPDWKIINYLSLESFVKPLSLHEHGRERQRSSYFLS